MELAVKFYDYDEEVIFRITPDASKRGFTVSEGDRFSMHFVAAHARDEMHHFMRHKFATDVWAQRYMSLLYKGLESIR